MDWPTIVSEMGPWGCTLAVVVWAFLQKRNDPEKDEIFVRLRGVEERLTRVEADLSWIKSTLERMEAER